jgi:hypothetical protein
MQSSSLLLPTTHLSLNALNRAMTDAVENTTTSSPVVEEVPAVSTTTKPEAVVEEPTESDSEYETDDDEDEGPGLASLLQDVRTCGRIKAGGTGAVRRR